MVISQRRCAALTSMALLFAPGIGLAAQPEATQPEPTPSEAAKRPNAGYKKGFFLRSDDDVYTLKIKGRVQARYTLDIPEVEDGTFSSFSVPRARLTLSGNAFTKDLKYKFQADFGKGSVALKDFYADYRVIKGQLHIRAGQWKRPFSRQQLNSSSKLSFVDRSITDKAFGGGRDIGLAVHNGYSKSPTFEYVLGLFNGTGDKGQFSGDVEVDPVTGEGEVTSGKFSNVPDQLNPTLVVRLGYNYGGIKGYSEGDLEGGPFRFAVGASALMDFDAANEDDSVLRAEVDFALKVHGFASTGAVYLSSSQSGPGLGARAFDALGFHLQAGYMIGGWLEPSLRYAMVAPEGADNNVQEILGGFSVYLFGHSVKWQTDGGALISEAAGANITDYLIRTQLQLSF